MESSSLYPWKYWDVASGRTNLSFNFALLYELLFPRNKRGILLMPSLRMIAVAACFFIVLSCSYAPQNLIIDATSPETIRDKPNSFNQVVLNLSRNITKSVYLRNSQSLAVVEFTDYDGIANIICKMLTDKVTSMLVSDNIRFQAVDRYRMNMVLQELKLGLEGLISSKSAQEIGEFLGANTVITGIMNDLGYAYDIDVRIVETKTAIVLANYSQLLDKSDPYLRKSLDLLKEESEKFESYLKQALSYVDKEIGGDYCRSSCGESALLSVRKALCIYPGSIKALRLETLILKRWPHLDFSESLKRHGSLVSPPIKNGPTPR